MKMQIPFCPYTGKAALEIEIPDDTESPFHMRAAVEIAIKADADLTGADLTHANLAYAYLARANLVRANLTYANLVRANLAGANLAYANLAYANLADADLAYANLAGAYLARANLAGAYLARATLTDANLAYANLAYAYLADANLADANLADGAKSSVAPVQIYGLEWPVLISDRHIQVGCEVYTTEEWRGFDNRCIAEMDGKTARQFWDQWKGVILAAADAHQSKIEQKDTAE